MRLIFQIAIFGSIALIVCIQIVLLLKYTSISRSLAKMRNQSSGDHMRFKNGKNKKTHF